MKTFIIPALAKGLKCSFQNDNIYLEGDFQPLTWEEILREEREMIADKVQNLPLTLKKLAPIEEAIVTRGGVSVKEIDPSTMESKLVSGLYFAGEVIDVDAHTGGYNLQIAWATGALAGTCAAEEPFI